MAGGKGFSSAASRRRCGLGLEAGDTRPRDTARGDNSSLLAPEADDALGLRRAHREPLECPWAALSVPVLDVVD